MRTYDAYLFNVGSTLVRVQESTGQIASEADLCGVAVQHFAPRLGSSAGWHAGAPHVAPQVGLSVGIALEPIDGAVHGLQVLKGHGKFVGVYTMRERRFLDRCLRGPLAGADLRDGWRLSLLEAGLPPGSPRVVAMMRKAYHKWHQAGDGEPSILVVGDALSDLEMAQRAGADFAAVRTGHARDEDFIRAGLGGGQIFDSVKQVLTPPPDHGVVALILNERKELLLLQEARSGHPYRDCWAGPHGVCEAADILEEQTVVRETQEECGLQVRPVRLLRHWEADTKVRTVSFWQAELIGDQAGLRPDGREAIRAEWVPLDDVGKRPLYRGMRHFFDAGGGDQLLDQSGN